MELYLAFKNAYVSLPSTAEHIVVLYTVAKTGPYSIFGLHLYSCSANFLPVRLVILKIPRKYSTLLHNV